MVVLEKQNKHNRASNKAKIRSKKKDYLQPKIFLPVSTKPIDDLRRYQQGYHLEKVDEFHARFNRLEKQWREETETVSSISKIISHPCYLKIIAMGKKAIPLILESLKEYPNHWFPALIALTDANPVEPGSSFEEATKAWLKWGQERSLVN